MSTRALLIIAAGVGLLLWMRARSSGPTAQATGSGVNPAHPNAAPRPGWTYGGPA